MDGVSSVATSTTDKGNILIVDDAPSSLHLLSTMLGNLGYGVRCAKSGTMALMAVAVEYPDLILLDIHMPDMDGYQVCEKLKADEYTGKIPVIFLSALNETIDKVKAFQSGGADYITKPFQMDEVLARIENQLNLQRLYRELQQAKADALKALEQEKELNRLKSEFVAMVSHDFRTPLTSIQGFAELIRCGDRMPPMEVINRYVDKINAAINHLLYLLDKILLIGSIEAGKMECQPLSINLETFCQELIDTLQSSVAIQRPIRFVCNNPATDVALDPALLQQILTNLLSNAIKYSAADSPVDLTVNYQRDFISFQVRDQGIGIPSENQSHLFEAFYRGSNVREIKGTGLGLAVVKQCVDAHRGHIELTSQVGAGTTVTVTLPCMPAVVGQIPSSG